MDIKAIESETTILSPAASQSPALQSASLEDFRLEGELGRGGMGVVYLARDTSLNRLVAIKVLLPGKAASPELRERFVREARMAAGLSHPHIVPVYRIIDGEELCIVTAYVDGETLAQRIGNHGPLESSEAARVLREVAWALGYAHARGIIHRDVKPENILLERGSGRALLSDFGIARQLEAGPLTATGAVLGSVHYLSPEHASGEVIDGRSDLYSLGVTGYYAVTGMLPIDGPSVPAILVNHLTTIPHPVRDLNKTVSAALASAIDRCLAKSPEQRFESPEAFARAIAPAVGHRIEIPPLVRGWINRGEITVPVLLMWVLPVALAPTRELNSIVPDLGFGTAVQRLAGLIIGGAPAFVAALLIRSWDLRHLVRAGFSLQDIRFGVTAYAIQRSEELEARRERATRAQTLVRGFTIGAALVVAAATIYSLLVTPISSVVFEVSGLLTAMLALAYAVVASGEWNRVRHYRSRMWNSSLGAFLFRIATRKRESSPPTLAEPEKVR